MRRGGAWAEGRRKGIIMQRRLDDRVCTPGPSRPVTSPRSPPPLPHVAIPCRPALHRGAAGEGLLRSRAPWSGLERLRAASAMAASRAVPRCNNSGPTNPLRPSLSPSRPARRRAPPAAPTVSARFPLHALSAEHPSAPWLSSGTLAPLSYQH
jgi:hypothetical protein